MTNAAEMGSGDALPTARWLGLGPGVSMLGEVRFVSTGHAVLRRVVGVMWPYGLAAVALGSSVTWRAVVRGRGGLLPWTLSFALVVVVAIFIIGGIRQKRTVEAFETSTRTRIVRGGGSREAFVAIAGLDVSRRGVPDAGDIYLFLDRETGVEALLVPQRGRVVTSEVGHLDLVVTRRGWIVEATVTVAGERHRLRLPRGRVGSPPHRQGA